MPMPGISDDHDKKKVDVNFNLWVRKSKPHTICRFKQANFDQMKD